MHRTIRCCKPSCHSSTMVGDGLIEDPKSERAVDALRALAAGLGWTECDHQIDEGPCFRCPQHTT